MDILTGFFLFVIGDRQTDRQTDFKSLTEINFAFLVPSSRFYASLPLFILFLITLSRFLYLHPWHFIHSSEKVLSEMKSLSEAQQLQQHPTPFSSSRSANKSLLLPSVPCTMQVTSARNSKLTCMLGKSEQHVSQ